MKILVLGAGAWGTALAIGASQNSQRHHVSLWSRNPDHQRALHSQRENARYLTGFPLPPDLRITADAAEAQKQHGLAVEFDGLEAIADVPLANKAAWATYRQALRDVPQQGTFPNTIVWPTKPGG